MSDYTISAPRRQKQELRQVTKLALVLPRGRTPDAEWDSIHSWYGGLPRLPHSIEWPKDSDGRPFHFLAQLDLSRVPSYLSSSDLPKEGHLAFFADTEFDQPTKANQHATFGEYQWPCAVVYFKEAVREETSIVDNMPPVYGASWSYYHPGISKENPPKIFGKLALEYLSFETTSARLSDDLKQLLKKKISFSPAPAEYEVPTKTSDVLWRTVTIIVNECIKAAASRETALTTYFKDREDTPEKLQKLKSCSPDIERLLKKWLGLALKNDPNVAIGEEFSEVLMDDLDRLRSIFDENKITSSYIGKHNCRPGTGGHMDVPYYWYHGRSTREAYKMMITGTDEDFGALPENIQQALSRKLGLSKYPPKSHDMLCGVDADDNMNPINANLRGGATLLLEINSSFLWTWGDAGKLQFWIANSDFAERNWRECFLLLRSS